MTGRSPDMALDLVLWCGVKLENATVIEAEVERVDKYCDKLQASIDAMYVELKDRELKRQRAKAAKESNQARAHHFEVGDLVMITVANTSVNPVCKDKARMRWQGPFTITNIPPGQPSELHVRLIGDPDSVKPKEVHWTRCRRFAGKEFNLTPRIIRSAQNDLAKFRIKDLAAWRVGDNGKVQILVQWHGFEDTDGTWEDTDQLVEDAPYRLRNYLAANAEGHPPLQAVYDELYE